jgi:outer membrane protein W
MKKITISMLVLAMVFFMSASVYAAGAGIGKGSAEVLLQGTLSFTNSKADDTTVDLSQFQYVVGGGYFLTDGLQVGATHLGTVMQVKSGDVTATANMLTLDAFLKYYFYSKGQTVIPYVGIQGGALYLKAKGDAGGSGTADYTQTIPSYGGMGGLKYFITENVSFNTELNYRHFQFKVDETNVKSDNISLLLGFSYYF